MVADTMRENSKIKSFLNDEALIRMKRRRVIVNGKFHNGFDDSSSTSKHSNIRFTNGFKRSLLNKSIDIDDRKRIKPIENGCSEEQHKISLKNSTILEYEKNKTKYIQDNKVNCINISHFEKSILENTVPVKFSNEVKNNLIINEYNTFSESKEEINGDESYHVSTNICEDNSEIVTFINNLIDIVCYLCINEQNDNFPRKINNPHEISQNSDNNLCNLTSSVPSKIIENKETLITNNENESNQSKKIVFDNSQLSNSSSENQVILEDSNNNSHLRGQIINVVNDSFQMKNNVNNSNTEESRLTNVENNTNSNSFASITSEDININKSIVAQDLTENINYSQLRSSYSDKNDNEIKAKISTFTDINIDNSLITNSESNADNSLNKNTLDCVNGMSEDSFLELETLLNNKDLTFIKFEKICSKMVFKLMKDKFDKDKQHLKFQTLKESESLLGEKYGSLFNQLTCLKGVIKKHKNDLKKKKLVQPHQITRTVGLQAICSLRKDDVLKSPENVKNVPVIQIDDDDSDNNDNDVKLKVLNSGNSNLSLSTKITRKKAGLPISNIIESPSVIEIDDDDELELKILNSKNSSLSLCTKITEKKDGLPISNVLENPSVIEIDDDDDEFELKTLNSKNSSLPLCSKITEKQDGSPVPDILQNFTVIDIDDDGDDDEFECRTLNVDNSGLSSSSIITKQKESKEQLSRSVIREHVDITGDDDNFIDLDKRVSNKQFCKKSIEKKADNIKLSNKVFEPLVDITSDDDDVTIVDTKISMNLSHSKIIDKKTKSCKVMYMNN